MKHAHAISKKAVTIGVGVATGCALLLAVLWLCLVRLAPTEQPTDASSAVWEDTTTAETTTTTTEAETTTADTTEESTTTTTAITTTTTKRKVVLEVTSHPNKDITVTESATVFTGTSDPTQPLLINGKAVEREPDGAFSVEFPLTPGANYFTFSHKGKEATYIVRYNFVIIQSFSPSGSPRYKSGSTMSVVVTARKGSTVKATFRGQTVTLTQVAAQQDSEQAVESRTFVTYVGSFALPKDNVTDLSLGAVSITATCDGKTATRTSGNIVCEKAALEPIAEIITYSAETFNGNTADDASRPTNNYLPQGTVDYVVGRTYYEDKEYLNLRCGRRVYVTKKNEPGNNVVQVTKQYAGTLPDTNRLSVAGVEMDPRLTTVTLNTQWKAPFLLDLLPQTYTDAVHQNYTVSDVTCAYVEIKFCYASALTGDLTFPKNHPVFTRAEIKKGTDSCTLRLYLKKTGGFYGWDAFYNAKGQLVFQFLHPAQVKPAKNAYGADLSGVKILLDVGHGGASCGAVGLDNARPEAERNLYLAGLLKKELESIGATVILNRTDNSTVLADTRCQQLKKLKPDLCIAIHHDANGSAIANGFGSFYSTLFSREAARYIYEETMKTGIYNGSAAGNRNRLDWHYYFVARMSDCPVVLTENGFMTSALDHKGIMSDTVNWQKAQAITRGVAKYFLSIRLKDAPVFTTTTEKTTKTTIEKTTATTTQKTVTTTKTTTTVTALPPATTQNTTHTTAATTSATTVSTTAETTSTESTTVPTMDTDTTAADTTQTETLTTGGTTAETSETTDSTTVETSVTETDSTTQETTTETAPPTQTDTLQ
ncbi:MAG: N-acetylmuramoyl-L-alanine amidase [Clostridia bacterium]|nr:N-acetylmuramoyl-L-alanine amidase [Clostridia bacterium]